MTAIVLLTLSAFFFLTREPNSKESTLAAAHKELTISPSSKVCKELERAITYLSP